MNEKLIGEIFDRMTAEGFIPCTEQYEICKRSFQFLDFSYKRSEELEKGTTVDCSTLVSQSHWEGAAIGIPFVAENQRTATSGQVVSAIEGMIPADVLVKYPSLDASPDKTWNHVGLYLGRDIAGEQWLIESTSRAGVRLSRVAEFNPLGGIKRFTLTREAFISPQAQSALTLTLHVPKFGRLGVRQYRKSGTERLPHKGLDIYVPDGTRVYATLAGRVSLECDSIEHSRGVEIATDEMTIRYLMIGKIVVQPGDTVYVGDLLGQVVPLPDESDIVYSSAKTEMTHLHLEVEISLTSQDEPKGQMVIGNKRYLNHLYLSKIGKLQLPFRS